MVTSFTVLGNNPVIVTPSTGIFRQEMTGSRGTLGILCEKG